MRKIRLSLLKIFPASVIICGTTIYCASCAGNQNSARIVLTWENNRTNLDALSVNFIKCEATIYVNNIIDNSSDIVTWAVDSPLSNVRQTRIEHFIEFSLDPSKSYSNKKFKLTAWAGDAVASTYFSVSAYTPNLYSNTINLDKYEYTLDYENNLKEIDVVAIISGTSLTGVSLIWNCPTLSEYFETPVVISTPAQNKSQITLKFKNGINATDAAIYNIGCSVNNNSAAAKNFILKTKNWENWQSYWIPRRDLNISGQGVLSGLISGADVSSNQYTTLHIPREVLSVSANAFDNKTPPNITELDLSASKITRFESSAFQNSKFTNNLVLPSSVTTLSTYCFDSTSFSGIDLSLCDNLKNIIYSAFSNNLEALTIKFNNNLETLQDAVTMAPGVFDGNADPTKYSGTIVLPQKLTSIGVQAFKEMGTGITSSGVTFDYTNCQNLTRIKTYAFYDTKFEQDTIVNIPNTVTQIGYAGFCGTKNIKKVIIPNSISLTNGIDVNCFENSTSLKEVRIEKTGSTGLRYSDTLVNPNTTYFSQWLRGTPIDKNGSASPEAGCKIEVPNSLLTWYQTNWPQRFSSVFVGY